MGSLVMGMFVTGCSDSAANSDSMGDSGTSGGTTGTTATSTGNPDPPEVGDICDDVDCGDNGFCAVGPGDEPICICDEGYYAEGLTCVPGEDPCAGELCSSAGECEVVNGEAVCNCEEGFEAMGLACTEGITVGWTQLEPFTEWNRVTMRQSRKNYPEHRLADGRAFFVMSETMNTFDDPKAIHVFDPADNSITQIADPPADVSPRSILGDGRLLAVRDMRLSDTTNEVVLAIYNPDSDSWEDIPNIPLPEESKTYEDCVYPMADGSVYYQVFDGVQPNEEAENGHVYDPGSNAWEAVEPVVELRQGWILPQYTGYLYSSGRIFDPEEREFTVLPKAQQLPSIRSLAVANDAVFAFDPGGPESPDVITRQSFIDGDTMEILSRERDGEFGRIDRLFTFGTANRQYAGFYSYFWLGGQDTTGVVSGSYYADEIDDWIEYPDVPGEVTTNDLAVLPLDDGFVLFAHQNDQIEGWRLQVDSTAEGLAPRVAPNAFSVEVEEGETGEFSYTVIGAIPPGGVNVVAEWVGGSEDVVIVEGASTQLEHPFEHVVVKVAALADEDGDNDKAAIRLRVVQPEMDPHAKIVTVDILEP